MIYLFDKIAMRRGKKLKTNQFEKTTNGQEMKAKRKKKLWKLFHRKTNLMMAMIEKRIAPNSHSLPTAINNRRGRYATRKSLAISWFRSVLFVYFSFRKWRNNPFFLFKNQFSREENNKRAFRSSFDVKSAKTKRRNFDKAANENDIKRNWKSFEGFSKVFLRSCLFECHSRKCAYQTKQNVLINNTKFTMMAKWISISFNSSLFSATQMSFFVFAFSRLSTSPTSRSSFLFNSFLVHTTFNLDQLLFSSFGFLVVAFMTGFGRHENHFSTDKMSSIWTLTGIIWKGINHSLNCCFGIATRRRQEKIKMITTHPNVNNGTDDIEQTERQRCDRSF